MNNLLGVTVKSLITVFIFAVLLSYVSLVFANDWESHQCPVNHIKKIEDSTVICVAQNQEQNQEQEQNNNQEQNVEVNSNAEGGNSSSSSSSSSRNETDIRINNNSAPAPAYTVPATTYVYRYAEKPVGTVYVPAATTDKGGAPQVIAQTPSTIKELPKTGLPLAGIALASLLPGGFMFKKLSKKGNSEASANSIWMDRQLNS